MSTYIVDWENETIEGPFTNKDQIIDFLLMKIDGIELHDTLKSAYDGIGPNWKNEFMRIK